MVIVYLFQLVTSFWNFKVANYGLHAWFGLKTYKWWDFGNCQSDQFIPHFNQQIEQYCFNHGHIRTDHCILVQKNSPAMADRHFSKALQWDDRTWCGCAESSQWGQSGGLSSLQVPRPPSTLTCSARWSTWPTCPRSLPPPLTRTCSAAPPPLPPLPQHLFPPPRSCKCTVCKKRKWDKNKK